MRRSRRSATTIDVSTEIVDGHGAAARWSAVRLAGARTDGRHAARRSRRGTIARLASAHGRVLGADAAEIAAAEELVRRVLDASRPARRPRVHTATDGATARCRSRGAPMPARLSKALWTSRTPTSSGFVVVDFKTDRELEGAVDRYQRQVSDLCGRDRGRNRPIRARRADARVRSLLSAD